MSIIRGFERLAEMDIQTSLNNKVELVSAEDVDSAYERIGTHIRHTPLCSSLLLNRALGFDLSVKAEVLQFSGSFKFRGASNRIRALKKAQPECAHVIAYSSGNHGQAVAAVASLLGYKATIVMPKDAPKIKIDRTNAFGAEIVFYDRYKDDREAIGAEISKTVKGCLVPPYEDPYVIAGQGTLALEIIADMKKPADIVIVPAGGGGLIAGVGLAIKRAWPRCEIYAAEPEGFDDYRLSLLAGERKTIIGNTSSICDAVLTPMPGALAFSINQKNLSGSLIVSDEDALKAIQCGIEELKLVIEPGGAVALAAALKYRDKFKDKNVVVVASGGNLDPAILVKALNVTSEKH